MYKFIPQKTENIIIEANSDHSAFFGSNTVEYFNILQNQNYILFLISSF